MQWWSAQCCIGKQGETAPPGSRKATFAEACGLEIYPLFTDAK